MGPIQISNLIYKYCFCIGPTHLYISCGLMQVFISYSSITPKNLCGKVWDRYPVYMPLSSISSCFKFAIHCMHSVGTPQYRISHSHSSEKMPNFEGDHTFTRTVWGTSHIYSYDRGKVTHLLVCKTTQQTSSPFDFG